MEYDTAPERLRALLRTLHAKTGRRVVVLVDEYDKPLLDALDTRDLARANRDYLRGLFRVVEQATEGAALAQIKERGYADKYRASSEPIHLIGVEFSKETRNVTAFEVERVC